MSDPRPHTLWFRSSTRRRWVAVAAGLTQDQAVDRIAGSGDWLIRPDAGPDPNAERPGFLDAVAQRPRPAAYSGEFARSLAATW